MKLKLLILTIFTLISTLGFSQKQLKSLNSKNDITRVLGEISSDSAIVFPKDTIHLLSTDRAIACKNNIWYTWSGTSWVVLLSGTSQIQSDWNQTNVTLLDYIKNKPSLFSGSYTDLTSKPTIPAQFNPIAGTAIGITGTYPNITFNYTGAGGGTYTTSNGLNLASSDLELGGTLTKNTTVDLSTYKLGLLSTLQNTVQYNLGIDGLGNIYKSNNLLAQSTHASFSTNGDTLTWTNINVNPGKTYKVIPVTTSSNNYTLQLPFGNGTVVTTVNSTTPDAFGNVVLIANQYFKDPLYAVGDTAKFNYDTLRHVMNYYGIYTNQLGTSSLVNRGYVDSIANSGTYTPTITNITNAASYTAKQCQYMRVGSTVTVSGLVQAVKATATGIVTISLTLPITSTFSSSYSAGGTGSGISNGAAYIFPINARSGTSTVAISYVADNTTISTDCTFSFTYLIE